MKISFVLIMILFVNKMFCVVIEIFEDGTGDYTTIQDAIDSANNYDTILVHPGVYYENLTVTEKDITIISDFHESHDPMDIANTVLDGNRTGSVINIIDTNWIQIEGFTIRNGSGTFDFLCFVGGGIRAEDSSIRVFNCVIKNNRADYGGGILLDSSFLSLGNTTVKKNIASTFGGGFYLCDSNVSFGASNINCVYLNYAGTGNDLFSTPNCPTQVVYVDTFTVANPTIYHAFPTDGYSEPMFPLESRFEFMIQNHVVDEVASDLYVSTTGNDNNSGESPSSPLKTIAYAMLNVDSDSLTHRTVHVEDGVYSESLNQQIFPIQLKDNVSIIGESDTGTILDAESITGFFRSTYRDRNVGIRNLSLINGYDTQGIHLHHAIDFEIDNVDLSNYMGSREPVYMIYSSGDVNNLRIHDCSSWGALKFHYCDDSSISNTRIYDNVEYSSPDVFSYSSIVLNTYNGSLMNIINTEVVNNIETYSEWNTSGVGLTISSGNYPTPARCNLINSTIANNSADSFWGAAISVATVSKLNIVNSILYGNTPYQIVMNNQTYQESLFVRNSIIQGGEGNIAHIGQSFVDWQENNMNDNPLWDVSEGYYFLSSLSPAIDNGTLVMPEDVELPEFDLTGFPRIYGGQIDIGCHEWNPVDIDNDYLHSSEYKFYNYPNPFNPTTTINYSIPGRGNIKLAVFNVKGQRVKTLVNREMPSGEHSVIWGGDDDNGVKVASGIYFYKLQAGTYTKTKKMILMK